MAGWNVKVMAKRMEYQRVGRFRFQWFGNMRLLWWYERWLLRRSRLGRRTMFRLRRFTMNLYNRKYRRHGHKGPKRFSRALAPHVHKFCVLMARFLQYNMDQMKLLAEIHLLAEREQLAQQRKFSSVMRSILARIRAKQTVYTSDEVLEHLRREYTRFRKRYDRMSKQEIDDFQHLAHGKHVYRGFFGGALLRMATVRRLAAWLRRKTRHMRGNYQRLLILHNELMQQGQSGVGKDFVPLVEEYIDTFANVERKLEDEDLSVDALLQKVKDQYWKVRERIMPFFAAVYKKADAHNREDFSMLLGVWKKREEMMGSFKRWLGRNVRNVVNLRRIVDETLDRDVQQFIEAERKARESFAETAVTELERGKGRKAARQAV